MRNLRGASPVGRDEESRLYVARMNSKGRLERRRRGRAGSSTWGEDVRAGAPVGCAEEPVRRVSWGRWARVSSAGWAKKSAEMMCIKGRRLLRLCVNAPNLLPGPINPWAHHLPARRPSCHVAPPKHLRGLAWPCHASLPYQRHAGARVGSRGTAM